MKIIFILGLIFFTQIVRAEEFIICSYKNGLKQIKLQDTKKIQKHEQTFPSGIKQVVVINDPWTLNDFDNYVILSKGDKVMTYSLDCKKTYNKDNK